MLFWRHLWSFFCIWYPQQLNFRGDLRWRYKSLPRRSISRMLSCVRILNRILFSKNKNLFRSWIIYGPTVLTNIIISRHPQSLTCSYFSWWQINLLINNCMLVPVSFAWPQSPYKCSYCCFCFYQPFIDCFPVMFFCWCFVIALKWSRMEV